MSGSTTAKLVQGMCVSWLERQSCTASVELEPRREGTGAEQFEVAHALRVLQVTACPRRAQMRPGKKS